MKNDLLLTNETAKILYQSFAAGMPILDYHCHLEARDIAEDKRFRSIAELWLGGDHYKWRQMRSNGMAVYEGLRGRGTVHYRRRAGGGEI